MLQKVFCKFLIIILCCNFVIVEARRKRQSQDVVVLSKNPIINECQTLTLDELEAIDNNYETTNAAPLDYASQFCEMFQKTHLVKEDGKMWEIVDSIPLKVGDLSYTRREIEQCYAVQKFLKQNSEDTFAFDPGFAATHALSSEAKLLGLAQTTESNMANEILSNARSLWRISDSKTFSDKLKLEYGFSEKVFHDYLIQREAALSILFKLSPSKKPTLSSFVAYLKDHGEEACLQYDLDIAVLDEKQMLEYKSTNKPLTWVSFGLIKENLLHESIVKVVEKMTDNSVSDPILLNNEYYVIKKKGADLSFSNQSLDKTLHWKAMHDKWLKDSVLTLQKNICCKAVKTILLDDSLSEAQTTPTNNDIYEFVNEPEDKTPEDKVETTDNLAEESSATINGDNEPVEDEPEDEEVDFEDEEVDTENELEEN